MLEDCRIPAENLLGGEEKLAKKLERGRTRPEIPLGADALATFEMTRPLVGASALGIAQAAYEWTLEYLDGRVRKAARRCCRRSASSRRSPTSRPRSKRRACWSSAPPGWVATGVPMTGGQGSMSKLKAGDVTMWATTTLMDLVGPDAWSTECPLEKFFRDAKIYQLFEGTAEIQRMVISRMQAREYAERLAYGAEVAAAGDQGAEKAPAASKEPVAA